MRGRGGQTQRHALPPGRNSAHFCAPPGFTRAHPCRAAADRVCRPQHRAQPQPAAPGPQKGTAVQVKKGQEYRGGLPDDLDSVRKPSLHGEGLPREKHWIAGLSVLVAAGALLFVFLPRSRRTAVRTISPPLPTQRRGYVVLWGREPARQGALTGTAPKSGPRSRGPSPSREAGPVLSVVLSARWPSRTAHRPCRYF